MVERLILMVGSATIDAVVLSKMDCCSCIVGGGCCSWIGGGGCCSRIVGDDLCSWLYRRQLLQLEATVDAVGLAVVVVAVGWIGGCCSWLDWCFQCDRRRLLQLGRIHFYWNVDDDGV